MSHTQVLNDETERKKKDTTKEREREQRDIN